MVKRHKNHDKHSSKHRKKKEETVKKKRKTTTEDEEPPDAESNDVDQRYHQVTRSTSKSAKASVNDSCSSNNVSHDTTASTSPHHTLPHSQNATVGYFMIWSSRSKINRIFMLEHSLAEQNLAFVRSLWRIIGVFF